MNPTSTEEKRISVLAVRLKTATDEERFRLGLEEIIRLTDGYDEYGVPPAWGANQIARAALRMPL